MAFGAVNGCICIIVDRNTLFAQVSVCALLMNETLPGDEWVVREGA